MAQNPAVSLTTIEKDASVSIEIKKSVFTANVHRVSSEEEAQAFVEAVKKKYSDARHNVFAYVLDGGKTARMSDDGEPQGTGGVPVLDIIKKFGVDGVCVVVSRYFGGILLGAPGLVRAYSGAAKLALEEAGKVEFVPYTEFELAVSYADNGRLQNEFERYGVVCDSVKYMDDVRLKLAVKEEAFETYKGLVKELGNGRYDCTVTGSRLGKK